MTWFTAAAVHFPGDIFSKRCQTQLTLLLRLVDILAVGTLGRGLVLSGFNADTEHGHTCSPTLNTSFGQDFGENFLDYTAADRNDPMNDKVSILRTCGQNIIVINH